MIGITEGRTSACKHAWGCLVQGAQALQVEHARLRAWLKGPPQGRGPMHGAQAEDGAHRLHQTRCMRLGLQNRQYQAKSPLLPVP